MRKLVKLWKWIWCHPAPYLGIVMALLFLLALHAHAGQYFAIPIFTSTTPGAVPASGGGTTTYLRADGTWFTPPGAGNVTGPGSSTNTYVPQWNGTTGTALSVGLPVGSASGLATLDASGYNPFSQIPPSVGVRNVQIFTTAGAGSYTATSNVHSALVYAIGGGAAGGGAAATSSSCSAGAGGGAGGVAMKYYTNIVGGQTYTFTIGAAGTGVSGGTGNNGGNTIFYNTAINITAYYGSGGATCAGTTCLSQFGSTSGITNAWFNTSGTPATGGICMSASLGKSGNGAGNIWGGGSNGQVGTAAGQYPASTELYQCGIGGGGALNLGTQSAIAGSAGTAGCVIIFEYE